MRKNEETREQAKERNVGISWVLMISRCKIRRHEKDPVLFLIPEARVDGIPIQSEFDSK